MPARWTVGMEAHRSVSSDGVFEPRRADKLDPLWQQMAAQWWTNSAKLTVTACAVAVLRLLRQHEPAVMRRR
ncbi:hypothetical protein GCM10010272_53770 [Streptomyces lateritius]|nr:hypothetical protein GCM10010272_53770 [Streptomyces lateritius]